LIASTARRKTEERTVEYTISRSLTSLHAVAIFRAVKLAPEDSSPVVVLLGHRHLCVCYSLQPLTSLYWIASPQFMAKRLQTEQVYSGRVWQTVCSSCRMPVTTVRSLY